MTVPSTEYRLLESVTGFMVAATSAAAAAVLLLVGDRARSVASRGFPPGEDDLLAGALPEGSLAQLLGAEEPVLLEEGTIAALGPILGTTVPEAFAGRAAFLLGYPRGVHPGESDRALLCNLSPLVAEALASAAQFREAEEDAARLRAVLDAAVNAIIIIDERGHIEAFNHSAERLFGYRTSEVIGSNVSMLMATPHQERHDGYLQAYLETGHAKIIGVGRETEARRRDGSTFPIDLSVGEIATHEEGRRFVGIIRDISQFKMVESLLRQRQEELRQTFANAPLGIATTDIEGRFLRVNLALCHALGYEEDDLLSRHVTDVVHPDDRPKILLGPEATERGEFGPPARRRFLRKDGTTLHGVLHRSAVLDADGVPKLLVIQIEDHTLRLQAESEVRTHRERLAHVARLHTMGEMATGIAHEVNQPLTAVSAYAQALRRMVVAGVPADDPDVVETLEQISAEARRAGDIIHRLRNMVRKRESERAECAINDIVRDVLELAEFDARQHDVALEADLAPDLPPVSVDAIQIQQVILNLLRNGAEASESVEDRRGRVHLRTLRGHDDAVEVRVTDNGVGLSAGAEKSVFHQFVTTKESGMGMGLSISRSIITSHGGEMWVTRNPDHGVTFHFTIPTREDD